MMATPRFGITPNAPGDRILLQAPITGFRIPHDGPGDTTTQALISGISVQHLKTCIGDTPSKPKLTLAKRELLSTLRGKVKHGIVNTKLDCEIAKLYLYLVFEKIKYNCEKDWESYGIKICEAGDKINPFTLLEVSFSDTIAPYTDSLTTTEEDDEWMPLYILGIYRITRLTNVTHMKAVLARIKALMIVPARTTCPLTMMKLYTSWTNNKGYRKIVAATDMFFSKFPQCDEAKLKIGTTGSRFRGCAGLLSIEHALKVMGISGSVELLHWIWTEQVASEIVTMTRENEEIMIKDSYFPYQIDMGWVLKCPYSTVANPSFFFMIHALCTLLGSERSKNRRFTSHVNIKETSMNAKLIAYVYLEKHCLEKQFTEDGTRPITIEQTNLGGEPTGRDPKEWYVYYHANDFHLTAEQEGKIQKMKNCISGVRDGTVGKYVKEHF